MTGIIIIPSKSEEYFCYGCLQLRLCIGKRATLCECCGSIDIKIAAVGSLDRNEELKRSIEINLGKI